MKTRILSAIANESSHIRGGFGTIYHLDEELTAKIFHTSEGKIWASKEFENLNILPTLDQRIRVPTPLELLKVGRYHELVKLGFPINKYWGRPSKYLEKDFEIYAVVMERIHGKDLFNITSEQKGIYYPALRGLLEAMIEHKLVRSDMPGTDIICEKDSSKVCLVDTHLFYLDLDNINQGTIEHYRWLLSLLKNTKQ